MSLIKKVSIVLVCLMVFSFCVPGIVRAEVSWAGKLVEPIADLTLWIGDAFTGIVHRVVFDNWNSLIRIDLSWTAGEIIGAIIAGIFIIAAVVVLFCIPGINAAAAAAAGGAISGLLAGGAAVAGAVLVSATAGLGGTYLLWNSFPEDRMALPQYSISPEEIFSNQIALFDVDFFDPMGNKVETVSKDANGNEIIDQDGNKVMKTTWVQDYKLDNGKTIEITSTAGALQSTIATWYKMLRDIAIVASLSILVYIGIRILLSSTSNDKAKYKQMIFDWIVALCLLFVMQYIMSFSNIIVDKVTDLVKAASFDDNKIVCAIPYDDKILESINKVAEENNVAKMTESDLNVYEVEGKKFFYWSTNLMGNMRIAAQQNVGKSADAMGHAVCFMALVFFTIFFAFTYLKRIIYMAFLTMIAPLVAMTYPIDKINDGKAQAFNMWLKEYIFNLLIQPLHLLLYTVLVSSAWSLASTNILYALVALGFMMPAEKLMRRFFGFEKAQTPGMLAGPAGAAMMMTGMNKLLSKGPKGGNSSSGKSGGSSSSEKEDTKVKTHKNFDTDEEFGAEKLPKGNDEVEENEDETKIPGLSKENEEENNESPFFEDRMWNAVKASTPYQWTKERKDAIIESGRNAKNAIGNKISAKKEATAKRVDAAKQRLNEGKAGRFIRGVKNLPNNSRIANAGVNLTKNAAKAGANIAKRGAKATGRATKYYAKGMANKMVNGVKNAHLGRRAIRMAGGAALGTVTGAMGLAAGIASGDPSKAMQYTGAAAFGGYKLAYGTIDKAHNVLDVEGTDEIFKENYYGKKEYENRQIEQAVREKKHDLELKWKLEDKFGKEVAKKYMKDFIPEATGFGISDNKTIAAMIEMQEKKGYTDKEAIAAALTSERDLNGKDYYTSSAKTKKEFEDTIRKRGKERSLEGDNLDKFTNRTVEAVKDLDKLRFK